MNGFMFGSGPSRRFIGEARSGRIRAVQIIPGGESGVPGTPFFGSMLGTWLTNEYHEVLTTSSKVNRNIFSEERFEPGN